MGSVGNSSGSRRLNDFQALLDGKRNIRQGLDHLCDALKDLRCDKEYDAQINVVNGIHKIKIGLGHLKNGLRNLCSLIRRENLRRIKEGVRDVCQGLKDLCCVLKDICCGRKCEAEKGLVKAIELIEEGLCKIEKGLEDICVC